MSRWPMVLLGEICSPAERKVMPVAGQIYRQLGVRLWGEGTYERETIDGVNTKYAYFNKIEADDLVVNKIWARNGSVAVATPEQIGAYVSTEFPVFVIDHKAANPKWIRLLTKWRGFWEACDEKAQGTSGKNRIKPQQFLSIAIPLPSLEEQQTIVARLDAVAEKIRQTEAKLDEIEADAVHLLAIRFRETIDGAEWRPMAEVAPLVRRNVEIDTERCYSEVGARSFGKGLFFKPHFDGAEVTWQKPVWISEGNLVFSNIKAWEGAIAVAKKNHDGCIASHRYLTCVPASEKLTANFICYYLLSSEGLEQVGKASLGTADRNRTLNQTALGNIKAPVPSLTKQQAFDQLQSKLAEMKSKHQQTRQELKALLPSMLEQIFN